MAKLPPDGLGGARNGNPRAGRELLRALATRLRQGIDREDAELLARALERLAEDDKLAARNAFVVDGSAAMRSRPPGVNRYADVAEAFFDFARPMDSETASGSPQAKQAFLDHCSKGEVPAYLSTLDGPMFDRSLREHWKALIADKEAKDE